MIWFATEDLSDSLQDFPQKCYRSNGEMSPDLLTADSSHDLAIKDN